MMIKVLFSCPQDSTPTLLEAIMGFGQIGHYDSWSRVTPSTERFRPLAGANPATGQINELSQVTSDKIELICHESELEQLIQAIQKHHPYELPAIEAFTLLIPKP